MPMAWRKIPEIIVGHPLEYTSISEGTENDAVWNVHTRGSELKRTRL